MRPFVSICFVALLSSACGPHDDIRVLSAPPELVEISFGDRGDRLNFLLPGPEWRRIEETPFRGFLYGTEGMTLRVVLVLDEDRLEETAAAARRDPDAVVRVPVASRGWPFIGAVVSYRGPPDPPFLEVFLRSFKVERR